MPRGDRTGPAGMGAMTGRAAGFCAGYDAPGYMNGGFRGRGFGRGRGWGMGMGFRGGRGPVSPNVGWNAPPPATAAPDDVAALKQQAEYLQETLKSINDRIEELEKKGNNE